MSYKEIEGNLFNSKAQVYVNTVNCVGAMGKGIALEFRRRYPLMFEQYKLDCAEKKLLPGRVYSYPQPDVLILNFAIKNDWKHPSKLEWVESTLRQFTAGYRQKGIQSIAFPWMGAMNGGIPFDKIQTVMRQYLQPLQDIDVEVYTFDPDDPCPLFQVLKRITESKDPMTFQPDSGLRKESFEKVIWMVRNGGVTSLARLEQKNVVGKIVVNKLYYFLTGLTGRDNTFSNNTQKGEDEQLPLFK